MITLYCQSVSKSLKTGRAPEVETWRQLVSSLEDRIKTHQQGGFSTNLAPGKLVGKLLNLFDSTAHRVVGGLPPPVPSASGHMDHHHQQQHQPQLQPRVSTSQSTMAMSSLVPSASMEPDDRKIIHNRSVSAPDFSQTPNTAKENSETKTSSRFGRFGFGSQLFQKTVELVLKPRGDKQAKLGDTNKFYYDEKLKRWVEEGVDPPAEEAALPPPPTMNNGTPEYNLKTALKSEGSDFTSPMGLPPIPATSNQFSARGRTGVRARYVDTFNQGGGNPSNLFQSPTIKPPTTTANPNPKFFVPTASAAEQPIEAASDYPTQPPTADVKANNSFQSFSHPRQKFASMDNVSEANYGMLPASRRTASWGSFSEQKPVGPISKSGLMMSDELQEVDL